MLGWPIAKVLGLALAASLLANLATWQGGRWYQSRIDAVAYRSQTEIRSLKTKVAALEWAAKANAESAAKIGQAQEREIAARHQAEARAREESDDADEWEKRYDAANKAMEDFKCPPVVDSATPRPALRCPDPFFSPGELQRLRAKYPPAKARPSSSPR